MKLTDKELEVMDVLWESKTPMTVSDILRVSKKRTWKENSIFVMMKRLESKKAVALDHYRATATNNARAYAPLITFEQFVALNIASINKARKPKLRLNVDSFIKTFKETLQHKED